MKINSLPPATNSVCKKIDSIIQECTALVEESVSTFVNGNQVKKLGGLIREYTHFLEQLEVSTRQEAESGWIQHLHDDTINDSVEALMNKEDEFQQFLDGIDNKLASIVETDRQADNEGTGRITDTGHEACSIGDVLPQHDEELHLVDVSSCKRVSPFDYLSPGNKSSVAMVFLRHFG